MTVNVDLENPIRARRMVKGQYRQDTYFIAVCSCGHQWEIRADSAQKVQMCEECSQRIKARKGGRATLRKYGRSFLIGLIRESRLKKPSCLERTVEAWLIELGVFYEREYPLHTGDGWIGLVDFMCEGGRLAIEVQGRYWHEDEKAIKRDARKAAALNYDGIPLLVLTEAEIVNGEGYTRLANHLALKENSRG